MNPSDLHHIVEILLNAAKLTEAQKFEFMGRINMTIMSPSVQAARLQVSPERQAPAAPVSAAPVVASGKVMIPKGHECECDMCKAIVYRIITDVLENMPKRDFVAAFVPVGEAPTLLMPLDTWADS